MSVTEGVEREGRRKVARRREDRYTGPPPAAPAQREPGQPLQLVEEHGDRTPRLAVAVPLVGIADALSAALVALLLLPALTQVELSVPLLLAVPGMMILARVLGRHCPDGLLLRPRTLDEMPKLLELALLWTFALWVGSDIAGLNVTGVEALAICSVTLVALGGTRAVARALGTRATAPERCLAIGAPAAIGMIVGKLGSANINAHVVASIDTGMCRPETPAELADMFRALVKRHSVDRAIIAPGDSASAESRELVRAARHAGVRLTVMSPLVNVTGTAVTFENLQGLQLLNLRPFGLSRFAQLRKRGFDFVGSSLLLLAAAPAMALAALLIRLEDGGPVFFRQTRAGKDGKTFAILKFRSMVADADRQKDALRHLNEADGLFKIADDPRITRVGRMLRRSCLDELPQLINVWRGDMSLVGPRPLVVDEDRHITGLDRHRLHLTPGMTGNWQILGSARVPMREMVGIDYLYVAEWSLWNDIKILLRTVPYVLGSRGM